MKQTAYITAAEAVRRSRGILTHSNQVLDLCRRHVPEALVELPDGRAHKIHAAKFAAFLRSRHLHLLKGEGGAA